MPPVAGDRKKWELPNSGHGSGSSFSTDGSILGVYGRAINRPVYSMTLSLDASCITLELVSNPPEDACGPPTMLYMSAFSA